MQQIKQYNRINKNNHFCAFSLDNAKFDSNETIASAVKYLVN